MTRTRNRCGGVGAVAVLVGLAATGCGSSSDLSLEDGWAGTVETLPSGRVIVRNADIPLSPSPWSLQERLRIGSLDADGPTLFGQIGGMALDAEGGIYVLEPFAHEIRAFTADGTFRRAFGREGEGPGELSSPSGLTTDPRGDLWVLNWGAGRYSGFDPSDGSVADERRRQISFASFPWGGAFDDAGRLVDIGLDHNGEEVILRLDTAFVPADTLELPESPADDRIDFLQEGLRIASMPEPFAPQVSWKPRPRGGIVVGEGADYRLHRIEFSGDTTLTIELDRPPVPVRDSERDSALALFDRMAETLGGATADRRPDPKPFKPAHGTLTVDDQDRIWVVSESASSRLAWDVFGADGRYVTRVAIPGQPRSTPIVIRGNRVAVVDDASGVPTVVVYEILESETPR